MMAGFNAYIPKSIGLACVVSSILAFCAIRLIWQRNAARIDHQMFGNRSKYSSSSFVPPSPSPICFSDSMNSMRSIHLTILYPS